MLISLYAVIFSKYVYSHIIYLFYKHIPLIYNKVDSGIDSKAINICVKHLMKISKI